MRSRPFHFQMSFLHDRPFLIPQRLAHVLFWNFSQQKEYHQQAVTVTVLEEASGKCRVLKIAARISSRYTTTLLDMVSHTYAQHHLKQNVS